MNDKVRFAIVAFCNSLIPLLQSFGVISLTGDQVAQIMLVVNNSLGLIMLVWKTGQGVDQAGTKRAAEGAAVAAAVAADTVAAAPVDEEPSLDELQGQLDELTLELARRRSV